MRLLRPAAATAIAVWCVASAVVGLVCARAAHLPAGSWSALPTVVAFVACGWLLVVRRPRNVVGWLLLLAGTGFTCVMSWQSYAAWALPRHAFGGEVAAASDSLFVLNVAALVLLLPLLFPDGRLPSDHWSWKVVLGADLGYAACVAFNVIDTAPIDVAGYGRVANPFAVPALRPLVHAVIGAAALMWVTGILGSVAALVVRWRRTRGPEHQQIKWVVYALALAPWPFVLHDIDQAASSVLIVLVVPLVPLAVTVSVLRYRLYDIDRLVSRTVSYAVVTGVLVGVYVGCVALSTDLLPFSSAFGVAASTLVAAALFQPLRRRVQALVDRRFNRARYDAARVAEQFSARLRDEVELDTVRADLLRVVGHSVAPAHLSLWVAP